MTGLELIPVAIVAYWAIKHSHRRRARNCRYRREPISLHDRIVVYQANLRPNGNLACTYCGKESDSPFYGPDLHPWHVDHVHPVCKGGRSCLDNLVLSCATCNWSKGGK